MAPLRGGKGRVQSNYEDSTRSGDRKSQYAQSRHGGRPRGGLKRNFTSSRVDDQTQDDPEQCFDETSRLDEQSTSASDGILSDDDDEEAAVTAVRPYSVLLQSLNETSQRGQPSRKKPKKDDFEVVVNIESGEKDVDLVLEPEEVENFGVEERIDEDGYEEIDEGHDPFVVHLTSREESELAQMVNDVKNNKWALTKMSYESKWQTSVKAPLCSKAISVGDSKIISNTKHLSLKQKLKSPAARLFPTFNQLTGSLASHMFRYQDVLFPLRSLEIVEDLRKLACLHSLNHVFKTRDKVIKNNVRVASKSPNEDIDIRDQGFTRPKVLIILPTRQSCAKYVRTIISFAEPEQQENKKRFEDSYIRDENDFSEEKPEDFRELFGGNDDDMFRLGLKFTRKTIKFFSQFYNSDIIFASPLGLRMAIGEDGSKEHDHDFLSSIEIVILDQSDALVMQNWEHVEYIFEHLNLQPKAAHGCDFSRVRDWYLDNNAKYLRQTILFAAFNFPSLNKVYTRQMVNVSGKVKYHKPYDGTMLDLGGIQIKQTFSRFSTTSPLTDPDDRFNYFTTAIVPSLTKHSKLAAGGGSKKMGVLIYIPSYADFVRVRNYLATDASAQNVSFGSISEYTSVRDVARARNYFLSGRHSILLYTERAHHFRRYRLKGVKSIIMYGLPGNPQFYKEIVGAYLAQTVLEEGNNNNLAKVRSLFTRLDILKLERIVGTKRYMLLADEKSGDTFDFV